MRGVDAPLAGGLPAQRFGDGFVSEDSGLSTQRPPEQLEMAFEADQRLALRLREGSFQILIELNTPASAQPFDSAMALSTAMAARVAKCDAVAAIAVTDRLHCEDCHDPLATAEALMAASGKPVLMHLSGKGSSPDRIRATLAEARGKGIRNVLAVTGDRSDRHAVRPGSGRPLAYAGGYLDSLEILGLAHQSDPGFFVGAVVNPFKYNPADSYLQYFKMIRKLASGARFVVTHAGWDMKKLQELQWFLAMRQMNPSVIARLLLLSSEDIRRLERVVFPGVHVPREFTALLQRESDISATQSLAAQLPRIGLQAAGCRLMGYSGVQVAGIRDQGTLDMVLASIQEALRTYTGYDAWLAAWQDYHGGLPFEPVPDAYYVFCDLLRAGGAVATGGAPRLTGWAFPRAALRDRLRAAVLPWVLGERSPEWLSTFYRAALRGGDALSGSRLRACFYLDRGGCPKRLVYGACGGSTPDGLCEFEQARCFFHRVLAVADARHELDRLEEAVADD
jgi:methylenetetrahydrofolate reductase (NADPH)